MLRTPKGWTGPKVVDGEPIEGTFRAHQVPLAGVKDNPAHLRMLEEWMRSYHPEELFDAGGRLVASLAALAPSGDKRMGMNPHANGGKVLVDLDLPDFTEYGIQVTRPATERHESTRQLGELLRDVFHRNAGQRNFRLFCPDETNSNRLGSLLSVADHCLRSRGYVNLIVIDKQPQLQWLDMASARAHCARGASAWSWASNDDGGEPDAVLAAAGDTPTLEVIAAAWLMRRHLPDLKLRVVNVVDLMSLFPPDVHPHGMDESSFVELFTRDKPVVFAFHGYQRAIHEIIHGRPNPGRFHVRGFIEEGTTTTPFDMVVRNRMSRFHLCMELVHRVPRLAPRADALLRAGSDMPSRHERYIREHLEDLPEVRDWVWSEV